MAVQLTRRHFTVDDYYAMLRAGILSPDDRVELIDGEIVEMPPMGPGHAGSIGSVTSLLIRLLGERAQLRVQCPVRLTGSMNPSLASLWYASGLTRTELRTLRQQTSSS